MITRRVLEYRTVLTGGGAETSEIGLLAELVQHDVTDVVAVQDVSQLAGRWRRQHLLGIQQGLAAASRGASAGSSVGGGKYDLRPVRTPRRARRGW